MSVNIFVVGIWERISRKDSLPAKVSVQYQMSFDLLRERSTLPLIPTSLEILVSRVHRKRSRTRYARGSFNIPERLSLEDCP